MDVYAAAVGFAAFLSINLIMFVSNHVFDRAIPYSDEAILYNTIYLGAAIIGLVIMAVTLTCFHPFIRTLIN
ncbi:MAG: hypothetical protein EOP83_08090 [Verrucomicrobiaceae bacterium]|nr:MAG: hypothetical protein EOP83_08090 [Verrucomicrobiaceae bacterium]